MNLTGNTTEQKNCGNLLGQQYLFWNFKQQQINKEVCETKFWGSVLSMPNEKSWGIVKES